VRVVEIVDTLKIGGLERTAVDLAIQLRRRGHEVSLLCLRNSGPLEQILNEARVSTLVLEKPEGIHLKTFSAIVQYLKHVGADVVHTHNVAVHHYGAVAARIAGVPAVVNTRHGLGHYYDARSERLFAWTCRLTDRVVAVSSAAHKFFVSSSRVPARKWALIYNGIPVERFQSAPPLGRREITFGTVGRLDPIKDHRGILEAFALVQAEYSEVRLRILGDGPARAMLEEYARELELGASVQFEGASLDVSGFLAGLDIFVMGSKSEGLPLAVLEAMAAGLPVATTDVGGIPELIEDGVSGWLCPPSRPECLAAIMRRAISADRRRMGEVARKRVLMSHSVEQMAIGYETLFAEIAVRRGRVSRPQVAHV
jgi:glycosyltransferase involved in cell wall biosynthesis